MFAVHLGLLDWARWSDLSLSPHLREPRADAPGFGRKGCPQSSLVSTNLSAEQQNGRAVVRRGASPSFFFVISLSMCWFCFKGALCLPICLLCLVCLPICFKGAGLSFSQARELAAKGRELVEHAILEAAGMTAYMYVCVYTYIYIYTYYIYTISI